MRTFHTSLTVIGLNFMLVFISCGCLVVWIWLFSFHLLSEFIYS